MMIVRIRNQQQQRQQQRQQHKQQRQTTTTNKNIPRHRIMSSSSSVPASPASSQHVQFDHGRHVRYFCHCLKQLPMQYSSLDTNRLTLVHFAVQSLDILGVLDSNDDDDDDSPPIIDKQQITDWIMALQTPTGTGFQGGTTWLLNLQQQQEAQQQEAQQQQQQQQQQQPQGGEAHIAMTYTALCTLQTLNYSTNPQFLQQHLDIPSITKELQQLQRPDGSYQCCLQSSSEHDLRFLYCACSISYMLGDWSGVNIDKATQYIRQCKTYDGGSLALLPGQEGHGGSTFCGIASLHLMGQLQTQMNQDPQWKRDLCQWCVSRQMGGGMQGRPNKLEDTCYSYWIGGTLRLLLDLEDVDDVDDTADVAADNGSRNSSHEDMFLLDGPALRQYVLKCQHLHFGGFGKVEHAMPDVLHSFYSLAWLSIDQTMRRRTRRRTENWSTPTTTTTTREDHEENEDEDEDHQNSLHKLKEINVMLGICQDKTLLFQQQQQQQQQQS